ncbi:uncharacterized protein rab44 isoform X4 [Mugil cephalus]|uniref:uncharacterized protein rab44 isoform X4 n=1 Tax=Mugil cephalus TaxID=48193 RepID=UPI001FB6C4CB|nr:uncharacterized protein rab44 isoform X4 [Mugil cephalus]
MSAQSGRKKRIGSRRGTPSQRDASAAEKFHATDSTSAAQQHIPEEGTDLLNVLSKPDNSTPETQLPPSPEVAMNRRKLGSSRKIKGRLNTKDTETESYVECEEEVEGKNRGDKTFETTQSSQAIQLEKQEELSQGNKHDMAETPIYYSEVNPTTENSPEDGREILIPQIDHLQENETKLEGTEKTDTLQIDIENASVAGVSNLTSLSLPSCSQQIINNQSLYKREMSEEELNKRCEDTDLSKGDGSIEGINSVSESHVGLDTITPVVTTDKSSPDENIENESSAKHAMLPSPREKLNTIEEVSDTQLSEDVVNEVHKGDAELAEMRDMHQMNYSSDTVIHDVTENSDTYSGNLKDQAEIIDTSELSVRTDDFASEQEVLSLGREKDVHPIEERYLDVLEEKNEDHLVHGYHNTRSVDIQIGQMHESKGQVEDDMKHNIGPADKQNGKEKKSSLSPQDLTSDVSVPLDSNPQDGTVSAEEPSNTGFGLSGNRRKMGSSRRNKGKQRVNEPLEEDSENTRTDEVLETMKMPETMTQEESSESTEYDTNQSVTIDSSMFSMSPLGFSSDVQNLIETNYPETDQESLIPKSENLQDDKEEMDSKVFEKSMEATLEGLDTCDTLHSEEFRAAHDPEHAERTAPEEEVTQTDIQEGSQIDYTSESGIDDATENTEIVSKTLMDQTEIIDTYQSDLTVKNVDDSSTKQEVSDPDVKQGEHQTEEIHSDSLIQENEDHQVKYLEEKEDTALGQMLEVEGQDDDDITHKAEAVVLQDKDGNLSEFKTSSLSLQTMQSEISGHLESNPQDNTVSIDEPSTTGFGVSGNRRKMGSSRRNKGRQRVKEPQEEDSENTRADEVLETMKMPETMTQEESSQSIEYDTNQSVTIDSSMLSMSPPGFSSNVQNLTETNYPETDQESLIPKSENLQEDQEEMDSKVFGKSMEATQEGLDKCEPLHSEEFRAAHDPEHAERTAPEEVTQTDIQEGSQIDYTSESGIDDATENTEIVSETLMDQTEIIDTYQSDLTVKSVDDSSTKQEVSDSDVKQGEHQTEEIHSDSLTQENEDHQVKYLEEKEDTALGQMLEVEGQDDDDMTDKTEAVVLQDKEGDLSEFEKSSLSLQTMPTEISIPLDSQPQDSTVSAEEPSNTGFGLSGNRRKMGSSRRNKGRQRVKEPQEEDSENTRADEVLETMKSQRQ